MENITSLSKWLGMSDGTEVTPRDTGGGHSGRDGVIRDRASSRETEIAASLPGKFCAACDGGGTVVVAISGAGDAREPCRRCGGSGSRN